MKSGTLSQELLMSNVLQMECRTIGHIKNNLHWCLDVLISDEQ